MAKAIDIDAEVQALDAVTLEVHDARDAVHFRAIIAAAREAEEADHRLLMSVASARAAGDSWTMIGAALGVTKQAAQQRFARRVSGV